jgi:hypothetical protein
MGDDVMFCIGAPPLHCSIHQQSYHHQPLCGTIGCKIGPSDDPGHMSTFKHGPFTIFDVITSRHSFILLFVC